MRVESLVPAALRRLRCDEFLERLPEFDAPMRRALEAARAAARCCATSARLERRRRRRRSAWSNCARRTRSRNIALTDNVVRFATSRYYNNPLIVQGPGAGPEVTAGGVFADLLRLCAYLGARL